MTAQYTERLYNIVTHKNLKVVVFALAIWLSVL